MTKSKLLPLAVVAAMIALPGCAKLRSRDQLNQGVQAFKNNKYPDAVKHFKEAVSLDPTNQNAQLYLATAYMIQWVPGADSPDNIKNYAMAKQEFQKVLNTDPKNSVALAYMASMAYQSAQNGTDQQKMAALEDAKKWNLRRIEVNPKDAEPYYYLGVIDWAQAYQPITTARVNAHMAATDPGPLKDAKGKIDVKTRDQLKDKYEKYIQDGLDNLKKCLTYDKQNEDAMSYMNLLLREQAVLEDSPDQAKADVAQAEDWSNKSLETRKVKATQASKNTAAS